MKHTKTFIFAAIALSVITASLFAAYIALPKYLDMELYKEKIENEIEAAIGVPVTIGKLHITLKGGIGLEIQEVSLEGEAGGMLRIKKGILTFKLLPLITKGAFDLKKLELHSPEIVVVRDHDGTVHFIVQTGETDSALDKKGLKLSGSIRDKVAEFLRSYIFIRDGSIHFIDNMGFKKPVETRLENIDLSIRTDYFKNNALVNMRLSLPWKEKSAELFFKGEITQLFRKTEKEMKIAGHLRLRSLPYTFLQPYLNKFIPQKDLNMRFEGVADIKASLDGTIQSTGKIESRRFNDDTGPSFINPLKPQLFSLSYTLNAKNNHVQIKNAELQAGPVSFHGEAAISNLDQPTPYLSFTVGSSDIGVEWFRENIKEGIFPESFTQFVQKNTESVKVKVSELSFNGSIGKLLAPTEGDNIKLFSGTVAVKKMTLKDLEVVGNMTGINGTFSLSEGNVSLKNLSLIFLNSHVKKVSGNIKNILENPYAHLTVLANLDLSQLPKIAKNLPVEMGVQGFSKGGGSADLKLEYNGLLQGDMLSNLSGKIILQNADITHKGIKLPFRKANGTILFTSEQVEFKGLKWRSGHSRFNVEGFIFQINSEMPTYDLRVQTEMDARTVQEMKWIKTDNLAFEEGKAIGDYHIQGKKERLRILGETDLLDMKLSFLKRFRKERGIDTKIRFNGFLIGDTFTIETMKYSSGDSSLHGRGVATFTGKEPYRIEVESQYVKPVDLFPLIPEVDAAEGGNIWVKAVFSGEATNAWGVQITGDLGVTGANLHFIDSDKVVDNLDAKLIFKGDKIDFQSFQFVFEDGTIKGEGNLEGYRSPQVTLELTADNFNFDSILGESEYEEEMEEKEGAEQDLEDDDFSYNVVSFVEVIKGIYRTFPFTDLTMNLTVNRDKFIANPFFVDAFGGKFVGNWVVNRGKKVGFGIKGEVKGVDIVDFCDKMPTDVKSIEGLANVSVDIYGEGETLDEYRNSLAGNTSFMLRDGKIEKMTILSKIFSLLNMKFKVPDMKKGGMTYNSITGDAKIEDGIAKTDNFLIDSDSIRMTGIGSVHIGNATVDMVVGAQPFQALDKVLTHIPIIGRVLTGDEKSFIVSHYSVKGALEQPDVYSMPLQSVGKGVLGIIKRILTLPVDLIKGNR